jgi:hypothetical protein
MGIGRPFQCLLANFVKLRQVTVAPLGASLVVNSAISIISAVEPILAALARGPKWTRVG